MKCDRKSFPELFAYLDAYGLDNNIINKIDRARGNSHSAYWVLGYPLGNDRVGLLDLSNTPDRSAKPEVTALGWNMLNDGMDDISEKDWNKLKVQQGYDACEVFTIAGHETYGTNPYG